MPPNDIDFHNPMLISRLALLLLASAPTHALVLTSPRAALPTAPRTDAAVLGLFDFFKPETADEIIGPVENPAGFSDEEISALKTASISSKSPAAGPERYSQIDNAPASLLNDVYPNLPLSYYALLRRNTKDAAPPPEIWAFLRKEWPVLAERSDEELLTAMKPITDVYVDFRNVP